RIQGKTAVPLAEDAAIALRPARLLRTNAQHVVVEHAHDLDQRQGGAKMAAAGGNRGRDDHLAQRLRSRIEGSCRRLRLEGSFTHPLLRASRSRAFCNWVAWLARRSSAAPACARRAQASGRNSLSSIIHHSMTIDGNTKSRRRGKDGSVGRSTGSTLDR